MRFAAVEFDTMKLENESCITRQRNRQNIAIDKYDIGAGTDHTFSPDENRPNKTFVPYNFSPSLVAPYLRAQILQVHYFQAVDWKTHKHKGE